MTDTPEAGDTNVHGGDKCTTTNIGSTTTRLGQNSIEDKKELSLLWERLTEKDLECARLRQMLTRSGAEREAECSRLREALEGSRACLQAQTECTRHAEDQCNRLRRELARVLGLSPNQSPRGACGSSPLLSPRGIANLSSYDESSLVNVSTHFQDEGSNGLHELQMRLKKSEENCVRLEGDLNAALVAAKQESERGKIEGHELEKSRCSLAQQEAEAQRAQCLVEATSAKCKNSASTAFEACNDRDDSKALAALRAQLNEQVHEIAAAKEQTEATMKKLLRLQQARLRAARRAAHQLKALRSRVVQHRRRERSAQVQLHTILARAQSAKQSIESEWEELFAWRESLTSWWQDATERLAQPSALCFTNVNQAACQPISVTCVSDIRNLKQPTNPTVMQESCRSCVKHGGIREIAQLVDCTKDSRRQAAGRTNHKQPSLSKWLRASVSHRHKSRPNIG